MKKYLHTGLLALLCFLLPYGTGIYSDDLASLAEPSISLKEALVNNKKIATPLLHYTHQIFLESEPLRSRILLESLKSIYIVITFFGLLLFFVSFFPQSWAALAAFFVIFFPSHESSTFWFIGQHSTLSLGLYAWAFYFAVHGRKKFAILFSCAGSWISYGSTPFALGMGMWFFLKKQKNKGLWLIIPNVFYIIYYLGLTEILGKGTERIADDLCITTFTRRYLLQIFSFVDAHLGISFLIKTGLSIKASGWLGFGVSILLTFFLSFQKGFGIFSFPPRDSPTSTGDTQRMTICLLLMVLASFGQFALVGLYPQTAFNLGNRTGIYASLFLTWSLFSFSKHNRFAFFGLFFIGVLCAIGLNRHWRSWEKEQTAAISLLCKLQKQGKMGDADLWITKGKRYSRLGCFDHIEGASEVWVAGAYFKLGAGVNCQVLPLSRHLEIKDDKIIDIKNKNLYRLPKRIKIVDLDTGNVSQADKETLIYEIQKAKPDFRHWFQSLHSPWVRRAIIFLMPRMDYFFL